LYATGTAPTDSLNVVWRGGCAGKRFDVLGFTRPKTTASKPDEPEQLPGFGVFAPWLGGLAGWLAGGWWFQQREMTQVELMEMKSRELRNGRLAM